MLRSAVLSEDTPARRLEALRRRHEEISDKIEHARIHRSISDFYLNELKKQKLHLKDLIEQMAGAVRTAKTARA